MPAIVKIVILFAIAVVAILYIAEGISIYREWYRFYTDTHEDLGFFGKMVWIGLIVLGWIIMLIVIAAINQRAKIVKLLKSLTGI